MQSRAQNDKQNEREALTAALTKIKAQCAKPRKVARCYLGIGWDGPGKRWEDICLAQSHEEALRIFTKPGIVVTGIVTTIKGRLVQVMK
jgi:anti-sigma factor ChrR (cupin superfamily)